MIHYFCNWDMLPGGDAGYGVCFVRHRKPSVAARHARKAPGNYVVACIPYWLWPTEPRGKWMKSVGLDPARDKMRACECPS